MPKGHHAFFTFKVERLNRKSVNEYSLAVLAIKTFSSFSPPTSTTNSTGKNGLPNVKYLVVDKRMHLCYSDNSVTDINVI